MILRVCAVAKEEAKERGTFGRQGEGLASRRHEFRKRKEKNSELPCMSQNLIAQQIKLAGCSFL